MKEQKALNAAFFKIKAGIIFVLVVITVGILICKSLSFIAKYEPKVKEFIDRAKISLPVIGKIITDFESLNFSFAMETLTSANISIEHAIEQSMKVIKNSAYSGELKKSKRKNKKRPVNGTVIQLPEIFSRLYAKMDRSRRKVSKY